MGPLSVKGAWEVQVIGIVPYDLYSNPLDGEYFSFKKIIKL
jgi:hypothetical protein